MEKRRTSQPENRKEVYKFWLGFFEKATIVLVTVVVVPLVIGQLKYSLILVAFTIAVILAFVAAMLYLSQKIWYLPKDSGKPEK